MSTVGEIIVSVSALGVLVMWALAFRSVLKTNDFIVQQFHTNSGTSLRDVVNRLGWAADQQEATLGRMERAAQLVAENLVVAKAAVEGVASDLASAQGRADQVVSGQPGEAADAGAQGPRVESSED